MAPGRWRRSSARRPRRASWKRSATSSSHARSGDPGEGKDRLDHVIALVPDDRLAQMLDVVADQELWVEALDLLAHLGDEQLDGLEI